MARNRDPWDFDLAGAWCDLGPKAWAFGFGPGPQRGGRRRRGQMFESGEMKYVILELLREKPRHGYDIIKALEERMRGHYTPSAGTVYPTLQLLEDQGYVRAVEEEGRRIYHITPEGEAFLTQNRHTLDDIIDRVRDTIRDFADGAIAELNGAFARLGAVAYSEAWRHRADDPKVQRTIEILHQAANDIERIWARGQEAEPRKEQA